MYSSIKQIIKDSIEEIDSRILIGEVTAVSPIAVAIAPNFVLTKGDMLIPSSLREIKIKIKDKHYTGQEEREYTIREKIKLGDHLILINMGDDYLVIDKVGDIDEPIVITE